MNARSKPSSHAFSKSYPHWQLFLQRIGDSRNITGFTGAGISTESGIPDYRGKGGIWNKFTPVYFDEFVRDEKKRLLYWQRKVELWDPLMRAVPGKGHQLFKRLYDQKKLAGLITQNIDGLHEKSGVPSEIIVNLHGNTLETVCLDCGNLKSTQEILGGLDLSKGAPRCKECNGLLKPNTISFGQALRHVDLDRAVQLSATCDFMLVMGSTLVVQPAASYPALAKKNGAALAIITLSETPLDDIADFVFHMKIGDFVDALDWDA